MIYLTYGIKDTARNKMQDDFATYPHEKKKRLARLNRADPKLFGSIPGPYEIFNERVSQGWIDEMIAEYGNDFVIIGAWQKKGLEVGLYRDENDVIQGTPTYLIHAKFKDVAPKRYDKDNVEIPIVDDQDALSRMHVTLGQRVRLLV